MRRAAVLLFLGLTGCSTVSTPVLRHETAETLGSGKFRFKGAVDAARVFPVLPASLVTATSGVQQNASLFRTALPWLQASAGVIDRLDLSVGAALLLRGGGWNLHAKFKGLVTGPLTVSAMLGLGRYSSKGSLDFLTTTGQQSVDATLSASQIDFGIPVSYRFDPQWAAYSGLHFYKTSVSGSVSTEAVDQSFLDYGPNIGIAYSQGAFEGTVEAMFLRISDPVSGSRRFNMYFGVSGGVRFP